MKKLFTVMAIASLIFAGSVTAGQDCGQHNKGKCGGQEQTEPVVLTDTGTFAKDYTFEYTDLDTRLDTSSGVSECSMATSREREESIAESWDNSYTEKYSFNYTGGGEAIGVNAQLPVQIAYFDEDMTILGQGGLQLQGGMVQDGAGIDAEQNFTNTMVFDGLSMEQTASQSIAITGNPVTITCDSEVVETNSGTFEMNRSEAESFEMSNYNSFNELHSGMNYTNVSASGSMTGSYSDQSLAGQGFQGNPH